MVPALFNKAMAAAQAELRRRNKLPKTSNKRIILNSYQEAIERRAGRKFSTAQSEFDLMDMLPANFRRLVGEYDLMLVVRLYCQGFNPLHAQLLLRHSDAVSEELRTAG
jgi:hypothetical protein